MKTKALTLLILTFLFASAAIAEDWFESEEASCYDYTAAAGIQVRSEAPVQTVQPAIVEKNEIKTMIAEKVIQREAIHTMMIEKANVHPKFDHANDAATTVLSDNSMQQNKNGSDQGNAAEVATGPGSYRVSACSAACVAGPPPEDETP